MLRSAIIGCGQIAGGYDDHSPDDVVLTHAKAYQRHATTELVAVCDVDSSRAAAFARRWSVPATYTDVTTLLREVQPDIVSICTPDRTHGAILRESLMAKPRAIWCEKPLTVDVEEGRSLAEESEKRGIPVAVNYSRRWDSRTQWLGEQLRSVAQSVRGVVFYGKGLRHNGSHAIDLLLQWFGSVAEVQVLDRAIDYAADDPTISAHLTFESGAQIHLVGWNESFFTIWEMDFLTSAGRYRLLEAGRVVEHAALREDPHFPGYVELEPRAERWVTDLHQLPLRALENIVETVVNHAPLRSSARSAVNVLEICNSIIERSERLESKASCRN